MFKNKRLAAILFNTFIEHIDNLIDQFAMSLNEIHLIYCHIVCVNKIESIECGK